MSKMCFSFTSDLKRLFLFYVSLWLYNNTMITDSCFKFIPFTFTLHHWLVMRVNYGDDSHGKSDSHWVWCSSTWTCSLKGGSDLICSLPWFWRFAFEGLWLSSCDHSICSPQTAASLWCTSTTLLRRINITCAKTWPKNHHKRHTLQFPLWYLKSITQRIFI